MLESHFLTLKQIGILSPLAQIILMTVIFILTVIVQFRIVKKTGRPSHNYPPNTFLFFAPIYEEVIFRGLLLTTFISLYGVTRAVILTSILFGIWHIRSAFFMPKGKVIAQVLYTGLILGPVFAFITIATGNIWCAVILHFLNNLLAPLSEKKRVSVAEE